MLILLTLGILDFIKLILIEFITDNSILFICVRVYIGIDR